MLCEFHADVEVGLVASPSPSPSPSPVAMQETMRRVDYRECPGYSRYARRCDQVKSTGIGWVDVWVPWIRPLDPWLEIDMNQTVRSTDMSDAILCDAEY